MENSCKSPARRVVASTPDWHLSGVNVFTTRLFRELRSRGWETSVVITNPTASPSERASIPGDLDIVRLPATSNREIRRRQDLLRVTLTERAPCVYLPNYDFDTAGILPELPGNIAAMGIVHSDEDVYYQFIRDLGAWMDGIVGVSSAIVQQISTRTPQLASRCTRVPYGVPIREAIPSKPKSPPLRVLYAGRMSNRQKRIHDLARVIAAAHESNLPVEFDVAGDGPNRGEFERLAAAPVNAGTLRLHGPLTAEATSGLMDNAHVLVLTSEFEGLPVVMLEAMEAGCVPVVTRIRSGIDDLVVDGQDGFLFPVGDVDAAVGILRRLAAEPRAAESAGAAARKKLVSSEFTIGHTCDRYEALFENMLTAREKPGFRRKPGRRFIPRHHRWSSRIAVRWARLRGEE